MYLQPSTCRTSATQRHTSPAPCCCQHPQKQSQRFWYTLVALQETSLYPNTQKVLLGLTLTCDSLSATTLASGISGGMEPPPIALINLHSCEYNIRGDNSLIVSQGKSPDASTHQVNEGASVVANGNTINSAAVCNDLFSVNEFWEGLESRKTLTEKLSYKNPKVKFPIKHIAVKLKL